MTDFHLSVRTWMTAALVLALMAVCASPASGLGLAEVRQSGGVGATK